MVQEVQARHSIAIHCCTFSLTDEALDEPPQLLRQALKDAGLPPDTFLTLQHGGLIQVGRIGILNKPATLGSGPAEARREE
jgi:N-acyl-phosphatidylethanolamine-hydrolysing phospholipase D